MSVRAILTSDNHLDPAAAQYGSRRYERKEDFIRSFDAVIEYAMKNKPDLFLVAGDLFDTIQPRNPTRARTMDQFRMLHEKGIKVFLVSGHHDTPKSVEQGSSPISVYGNSKYVTFFQDFNKPMSETLAINGKQVQVAGISFNPVLPWGSDPLEGAKLKPSCDVNIFMLHYSIEGFSGYGKFEPLIRVNSLPKDFQLVAAGHLHRHQRSNVGRTSVVYAGSTERVNFSEENEDKGFVWLELNSGGITNEEFIKTPARTMRTADLKIPKEGRIDRFVREELSKLEDPNIILRYRLMGAVTPKQLSTYRRSDVLSFTQGKFFTVLPNEDELEIEASRLIAALPRTTPLQELERYFREQIAKASGEEDRKILGEAFRLCEKRLQEAGAW